MFKNNTKIELIFGIIILVILTPFSLLYSGFVIYKLWDWFIVPLGFTSITIAWAMGISTFVGMFRYIPDSEIKDKEMLDIIGKAIATAVVQPTFALFFGWIFSNFMPQ